MIYQSKSLRLRCTRGFRPIFCDFERTYCDSQSRAEVHEWCTWLTHDGIPA